MKTMEPLATYYDTIIRAWKIEPETGEKIRTLAVIDEPRGRDSGLYLAGDEFGAQFLIRADGFCSAWELMVDEMPTVPPDELHEAYGLYSQEEMEALGRWVDSENESDRAIVAEILERDECNWNGWTPETPEELTEYPMPIEGYEYQSNFSGTGIVNVGHHVWLREVYESDGLALIVVPDDSDDDAEVLRVSHFPVK